MSAATDASTSPVTGSVTGSVSGSMTGPVSGPPVLLDVPAADWREATRVGAGLLVAAGAANEEYPAGCVASLEQHGPYVVMTPGLALVHARPEAGALGFGLAVARLAEPVAFGHPKNDPVDLVLAFCSPGSDAHVRMIRALGKGLKDGLADRLRAADSPESAAELLQEVADVAT